MSGYVGAEHEFHDPEFVQGWANRFVPTQPRLHLFDLMLGQIEQVCKPDAHVLELGTGPGYMARHILERNKQVTYEALDFSDAFIDVARRTIGESDHPGGVHERRSDDKTGQTGSAVNRMRSSRPGRCTILGDRNRSRMCMPDATRSCPLVDYWQMEIS
jgi:SAM-dependent methyltransferase